jgi:predicted MFS family arabinose efflux permease
MLRLVAPNYEWALAGQIVVAIAQPFVLNGLTKTATAYLPPGRRGSGIALGSAAQFLGAIVALVMGPALEASHGVTLLLVVQAAIGCAAFVLLAASLRSPTTVTADADADTGPRARIGLGELRAAWSVRQLRTLTGLAFLDRISATDAGLMLAGMLAAGIAGCGILAPAVERRRAERAYLTISVLMVTVFMTVLAFVHPAIGADFALIAATGFVLLAALPVMLSLIERKMSEFGGVSNGVLLLAGNAGGRVPGARTRRRARSAVRLAGALRRARRGCGRAAFARADVAEGRTVVCFGRSTVQKRRRSADRASSTNHE